MTPYAPYAAVALAAVPLLVVVATSARDEGCRAVRAWTQSIARADMLASVAALAAFALQHAAQAPGATAPVVHAYCRHARAVLANVRLRRRLASALGASGSLTVWRRWTLLEARLLLLPFEVAFAVYLGQPGWLIVSARRLSAINAAVSEALDGVASSWTSNPPAHLPLQTIRKFVTTR